MSHLATGQRTKVIVIGTRLETLDEYISSDRWSCFKASRLAGASFMLQRVSIQGSVGARRTLMRKKTAMVRAYFDRVLLFPHALPPAQLTDQLSPGIDNRLIKVSQRSSGDRWICKEWNRSDDHIDGCTIVM